MLEITGAYASAKIFTDNIDPATLSQIYNLLTLPSVAGSQIRIMPDCHAGVGCVVGTTMRIQDAIIPNLVGVDIGCGMLAVNLGDQHINLPKFDQIIHEKIPAGGDIHETPIAKNTELSQLYCLKTAVKYDTAIKSLGTLGGGNHFIELDKDSQNNTWLVIHTGSRHLGIEVCNYYQKQAYQALIDQYYETHVKPEQERIVKTFKSEGRAREIPAALEKLKNAFKSWSPGVSQDLAACTGELKAKYLHDMTIVQRHAALNRVTIATQILKHADLMYLDMFDTAHNYIDTRTNILRKGAISAGLGERVLIPMNMRDGSLICVGKANRDWNYSAPHGAGRICSRAEAKANFSISEYRDAMTGIYTTSVSPETLDECPMAYKPMDKIINAIQDTVEIEDVIKPVYNFKA